MTSYVFSTIDYADQHFKYPKPDALRCGEVANAGNGAGLP
jgi:hypothetical protein